MYASMYVHIHTHTNIHTYVYTHVYIHTWSHAPRRSSLAPIFFLHTYTHTSTYTHGRTQAELARANILLSHGALDIVMKPINGRTDDVVEELYQRDKHAEMYHANAQRGLNDFRMRKTRMKKAWESKQKIEQEKMDRIRDQKHARLNNTRDVM